MSGQNVGGLRAMAPEDRMLLLKFVCSFAWSDLKVQAEERRSIDALVEKLELGRDERAIVAGWLEVPPVPADVDPQLVPQEHRSLFVKAIENVITADGVVTPREREQLVLFAQMLG